MNDPQQRPTVSAIIPCYNGAGFIAASIESILAQSMRDLELIVVDDGSTDNSQKVVAGFTGDARVRCVAHEHNKGIAAARNTGIEASSGEFIAFLDQDDLWEPRKLERQLEAFDKDESGEVGLVFTDHHIISSGRGPARRRLKQVPAGFNELSRVGTLRALYLDNFIPMISIVVRRSCLDEVGRLDESIRSGVDDYEFCTRMAQKCRIVFVNDKLVVRREHGGNFTDDIKLVPDVLDVNRALVGKYPELSDLQTQRESELYFKLGRAYQKKPDRSRAKQAYRDAICADPTNNKARVALATCHLGPFGDSLLNGWNRIRAWLG